jgi:hypothetical protein
MNDNKVIVRVIRTNGQIEESVHPNLRLDNGINWQVRRMFDPDLGLEACSNIAVTENSDAPSADTLDLPGEIAADGLSRQTAVFSHTADQSLATLSTEWKYTGGGTVTIAKAALVTAAVDVGGSADTHFAMTLVTPNAILDSNDSLAIDWGINV